jgi:hypothetical protein
MKFLLTLLGLFGPWLLGTILLVQMESMIWFPIGVLIGYIPSIIISVKNGKKIPKLLIISCLCLLSLFTVIGVMSDKRAPLEQRVAARESRSGSRDSASSKISDPSAINAISIYWNGIKQSNSYSLNPELFTNMGNFHLQEAITAYEQGPKDYPDARVTILRSRLILGLRAIQFKCGSEEPSISSARIALGENSKNLSSY